MRFEVICLRVLLKRGNRTKRQNYYRLQKFETFRKLVKTPRHFVDFHIFVENSKLEKDADLG